MLPDVEDEDGLKAPDGEILMLLGLEHGEDAGVGASYQHAPAGALDRVGGGEEQLLEAVKATVLAADGRGQLARRLAASARFHVGPERAVK